MVSVFWYFSKLKDNVLNPHDPNTLKYIFPGLVLCIEIKSYVAHFLMCVP